jgi:anti-sigma factor RsiW
LKGKLRRPESPDSRLIEDRLFAYAAGELDGPARTEVEAILAADPALRNRLAWYEAVCDGAIESLPPLENLPSSGEILERVRAASRPAGAQAAQQGHGERGSGFFAWLAGPGLRPATAFAAVLFFAQATAIAILATERAETPLVRSIGTGMSKPAHFMIAFDPATPESKIRALLLEAGATIVAGPMQLGDYRVSVPANRAQFAQDLFEHSTIVEYVRAEER